MSKLTIFQRLGIVTNPDYPKIVQKQPQRYNIGSDVLLKTDSKSEFERAKLQAQQNKYLNGMWKKVESGLFQQSINYETTRIGSYSDFEAMEFYPTISAALDVMMEESTTLNEKGRVLNIYSDSKRVKGILEDLFFNRLDLHVSLPMWTRNTCKYGDNFVYLNIDDKYGIVGAKQMPNYEMERRENGLFNMISGINRTDTNESEIDKTKFFWRTNNIEFNSWQIAHFRLLGDDRRLPYGTSVLEKSRRIWKQLILAEDSMLVYRVTRAPERRVYKIFVGNIDDADVPAYVNQIADRFKRTQITDPQTGQMDLRYNQLANDQDFFIPVRTEDAPNPIDTLPGACLALDTRIPLLDGRTLELQEIINEWNSGNKDMWVYSVNPTTGESGVGPITWAGITRKNTQVVKVTLDNGKSITTTPDHKWVHRTNGFVEAKDLVIGDSLMPFYTDTAKIKSKTNGDYHRVWDTLTNKWIFTHRLVKNQLIDKSLIENFEFDSKYIGADKKIIHHKDHNRFNNNPSNLVMMNGADHMKYHQSVIKETIWKYPELNKQKITNGLNRFISNLDENAKAERARVSIQNSINSRNKSNKTFDNNLNKNNIIKKRGEAISKTKSTQEFKEKFSIIAKDNWGKKGYGEKVFSKKQNLIFTDNLYEMFFNTFNNTGRVDLVLIKLNDNINFMTEFKVSNSGIRSSLTNLNKFTRNHLDKMFKNRGFKNYQDWAKQTAEELGYKNVRAWRNKIENDNLGLYNHKIVNIEWLSEYQDTGTITVDGEEKYQKNHTFACEAGVYVKNSNLDQIADIEYLRSNLFTALRVPKPFLGFDETTGEGKNLALQDIRFSRTINRIQQAMLQELNKIAIIHLYLLGFEEDFDNFTLTLNNPSTQAEMLKVEHTQAKITLYKDAVSDAGNGFAPYSMTRGKREILGMSDDEIKQDLLEQRMEKAAAAELANSANVIKHTGMFDIVDRVYGDYKLALKGGVTGDGNTNPDEDGSPSGGGGGGLGGSFGGGGLGGEDLDFGDEGEDEASTEAGGEAEGAEELASAETDGDEMSEPESVTESINKIEKLLAERKKFLGKKLSERNKKYQNRFVDNLIESLNTDKKQQVDKVKIYDKNLKVNKEIDDIVNNIDKMLDE